MHQGRTGLRPQVLEHAAFERGARLVALVEPSETEDKGRFEGRKVVDPSTGTIPLRLITLTPPRLLHNRAIPEWKGRRVNVPSGVPVV